MKNWLPPSPFEDITAAIERRLRADAPQQPLPPNLHENIMNRLSLRDRDAGSRIAPDRATGRLWLLVSSGAAAILLLALFWQAMPSGKTRDFVSAEIVRSAPLVTLQFGNSMAAALPGAFSPLEEELDRVQQDLERTKSFLSLNLP